MNESSDDTMIQRSRATDNPFTPHAPVVPSMFVGREREIDLIFGHLMAAQRGNVAVSGPLGSGKSSVLQYIAHPEVAARYGAVPSSTLLQYVDVQSVTPFTFEAFWRRVARLAGRMPGAAASVLAPLAVAPTLDLIAVEIPEHTILVHAAAGGVGLILCQWARNIGATVIGTVGSREKVSIAKANGADHVILSREEDVAARVREITGGRGVHVSYDSVGKETFESSMNSLAPLGMFVSYGNSSGNAPDVSPQLLQNKGSLFFTRPSLAHYTATTADLHSLADRFFGVVADGAVKIHINQRYPLSDLVRAHQDLEDRKTTGSTVILP